MTSDIFLYGYFVLDTNIPWEINLFSVQFLPVDIDFSRFPCLPIVKIQRESIYPSRCYTKKVKVIAEQLKDSVCPPHRLCLNDKGKLVSIPEGLGKAEIVSRPPFSCKVQ